MADLTTLADVKQWLNITNGTSDALLSRLITAASEYIQSYLNRTIASTPYSESYDGVGGFRLVPTNTPIISVASVSVDGYTVPQSTNPLMPGWVASTTSIAMRGPYSFTVGIQNIAISYTAGYVSVAADLAQACIEVVSLRFKEKDRIGVSSKTLAGESITFRDSDFSDSVKSILANYKKVTTS